MIINRNIRWPEAIPLRQQTAESCVKALINWVSRHGAQQYITSIRGANFTSTLWSSITTSLGTKHIHTTAYNPEMNGMVEQLHHSLKSALTTRCQGWSWRKELPWVLLGLRTTPHTVFSTLLAEALYSQTLTIPADIFQDMTEPTTFPDVHRALENVMQAKTTYYVVKKDYVPEDPKTAKYAFVRLDAYMLPLSPAYSGPHLILQHREKAYQLTVDGKITWVSINRLKPAYIPDCDPLP
ncbi:uncharacterized protein [Macrobrachium rosenbergii]|uniref:uncharacterized protein n=1 Tax=Macrobrachium rosenbergii TaxID=79674 RepID=UPI0034D72013